MKLKQITEVRYAGERPALLAVAWSEGDTDVYGPFKSRKEAQELDEWIYKIFEDAGLEDVIGEFIWQSNVSTPIDPEILIEDIKEVIRDNRP